MTKSRKYHTRIKNVNHNVDHDTVLSFGDEWSYFNQGSVAKNDNQKYFKKYFAIFPWSDLPQNAKGFDMGCGSGRWAKFVAPRVGHLHCIDPSNESIAVAKRNLCGISNVSFEKASVETTKILPNSQDFGYCIGVLHHIPDTGAALSRCTKLLKPGAPFLIYIYYKFDNRPVWYAKIWQISDVIRNLITRLPINKRRLFTDFIAMSIYFPLARAARIGERMGIPVNNFPLYAYRSASFYTMRTDSRDRFGTPLERRFTRKEIEEMMFKANLDQVIFSESGPYWCAVGRKKSDDIG